VPSSLESGAAGRPAAFIDRDGTLVQERHYLADPERVELVPGAAAALRALRDAGFLLVLVTNQSGIARRLYSDADFRAVQVRLEGLLEERGVRLDAVYHCPHHPDFTGPCDCRKPATGLFLRARDELSVDLARSVFVGDRLKDVLPALTLGGLPVLVRTGYGAEQAAEAPLEVWVEADLGAAAGRAVRWLRGV
jgi:D-glycero-D-manno-heptose 1,7-bisphosphate phosphatase